MSHSVLLFVVTDGCKCMNVCSVCYYFFAAITTVCVVQKYQVSYKQMYTVSKHNEVLLHFFYLGCQMLLIIIDLLCMGCMLYIFTNTLRYCHYSNVSILIYTYILYFNYFANAVCCC